MSIEEDIELMEIFDSPYDFVEINPEEDKEHLDAVNHFSSGELYKIKIGSQDIFIYEIIHDDAWEWHFNNSSQDNEVGILNILKRNEVSRLLATIFELAKKKLEKTRPIRLYGVNERMTEFYMRAAKTVFGTGFIIKEISNFKGADGDNVEKGYLVKRDTRTLKLENFKGHS